MNYSEMTDNERICAVFLNEIMSNAVIKNGVYRIPAAVCLRLYWKFKDRPSAVQEALHAFYGHLLKFRAENPRFAITEIFVEGSFKNPDQVQNLTFAPNIASVN